MKTGVKALSKAELAQRLDELGIPPLRAKGLCLALAGIDPGWVEMALGLAAKSGARAAEAVRAAADAPASLHSSQSIIQALKKAGPVLAIAGLRVLPDLARRLSPAELERLVLLVAKTPSGQALNLVHRLPAIVGHLAQRGSAGAALALAGGLAEKGMNPALAMDLVRRAARLRARGRLVLGLGMRVARLGLEPFQRWLDAVADGPGADLTEGQLCRWTLRGIKAASLAPDFFAPDSLGGLVEADRVSGAMSTRRVLPWLSRYASSHAARPLKLELSPGADPLALNLDLDQAGVLTLAHRLPGEMENPLALLRAVTVLAARARNMGLYEVSPRELGRVLRELGRNPPLVQEFNPPAIFCQSFQAPGLARMALGFVTEAALAEGLARLPGLWQDQRRLASMRRLTPRHWTEMEPAPRAAALCGLCLAGGDRPAQALLPDWELAAELAGMIAKSAPGLGPKGVYLLAGRVTARLLAERPYWSRRIEASSSLPGVGGGAGPGGEGEPLAPATPLSTMGPGPENAPPAWSGEPDAESHDHGESFRYPEWDPAQGRLAPGRACVRHVETPGASDQKLRRALKEKRGLARALERAFAALNPSQPHLGGRHAQGSELDISAVVEEKADLAAGFCPQGLVFRRMAPRKRRISCGVLWDVSGSTKRPLEGRANGRSVAEVSRQSLALFAEALQAAGDEFALWAFSGAGRERVDFYRLKDFDQPMGRDVYRRLAGLGPQAQNRDGAAVRHALRLLAARRARRKLLIIIGDGRPDDYQYGKDVTEEDMPLAFSQARLLGVKVVSVLLTPPGRRPHEAYGRLAHLRLMNIEDLARRLPLLYRRLTS